MNSNRWQEIDVRLFAVVGSLLLSAFTLIFPGIPNDDGYTYIRTADIFLQDGIAAATSHYTWAGYSILVGLVSKLGFSLFTAAHILNALFFALLSYSFVSLIKMANDSQEILWFAALTVLVFPQLNEYRDLVIRDHGFWALALFGLWQLVEFSANRNFRNGLLFCAALTLAAVFRVEAILYLALTPLALLFNSNCSRQDNQQQVLKLYGAIAAIGLAGLALLFLVGINVIALLLDFVSVYQPFLLNALNPAEADTIAKANAIFGEYASTFSRDYVTAVIAVGLLVVLFMNLFYAVSGPFFWLLAFAWARKHLAIFRSHFAPVLAYLLINLAILLVFLYITRYLTSRYALVFGLMVALQIPFVVQHIMNKYRDTKWQNACQYFFILFFAYCAIDAHISFGKPKDWLLEAASFVEENTNPSRSVITNNHTIAYYSGKVAGYDEVLRELTANEVLAAIPGDLFAIELYYEMSVLVNDPAVAPYLQQIAAFPAGDEVRVAIYHRVNP